MKIDWKQLARSEGYRKLKASYIKDVQNAEDSRRRGHRPMRDKAEFLRHFRWVIDRAKHYAYRTGLPIEQVLDTWEAKRTYWWLNYYQPCNQPKLPSGKPRNVKRPGIIKGRDLFDRFRQDPAHRFKMIRKERYRLAWQAREARGKKRRWPLERKRHEARMRKHREEMKKLNL